MGPAAAVGFRFPHQDPESIARGNAFVATADNPSAVYYNPAGITQLEGQHVSAGLYLASMGIDFDAAGGGSARAGSEVQFVPQLHYVLSPKESRWSFGLGINAPYGLGIDYGRSTPFSTIATEATLVYLSFNPVVAYEICPTLSVAAGPTINYSDAELRNEPGVEFKFEGNGWDPGFNLGLLWQPCEQWSFGLMYRSQTKINFDGDSELKGVAAARATEAEVVFPRYLDLGASWRPNEKWNLEFNIDWTDWDAVNITTFKGTFPVDTEFPFNYKSSFMYEFGATRYFEDGWFLSAGYVYSENSVPDETLSPFNPDANLHLASIGFGRRGEHWSWALGYHFAHNPGRTVTLGPTNLFGQSANGDWKIFNHGLNAALRYTF